MNNEEIKNENKQIEKKENLKTILEDLKNLNLEVERISKRINLWTKELN